MHRARKLPTLSARLDGPRPSRWPSALVWLYASAVAGVAALLHGLADVWWPATLLLFAPRWIWALPLLVLVPWCLWRKPRLLWVLLAAALVWLVAVAGFVVPAPARWTDARVRPDLRLVTYNIGGGELDPARIAPWLDGVAPDVVALQECAEPLGQVRAELAARGWQLELQDGSCLLSRHRIRKVEVRDPKEIWKMGGSGVVVRYEIEAPGRTVTVINLHLETVREGLGAILERGLGGVSALEANIDQRDIESVLARAFANQTSGAAIVAGDFNLPVESAIYRHHWGDLVNAFSSAGVGFGYTKATRWHGVRIDHVLLGAGWSCAEAWVGPDLGLDHRPLIADLVWSGTP